MYRLSIVLGHIRFALILEQYSWKPGGSSINDHEILLRVCPIPNSFVSLKDPLKVILLC